MPIITLQKRARELGRIRIGQKGDRGQPQKLDRFRITSPSKHLVEKVAELYGGQAKPWTPAGGSQQYEVITDATRLPIMVPPQPVSQFLETWTAAGCVHRCDGETNFLTGELCDPDDADHINAKPTTRLNVVLRDVEGVGVFRLESHGWNAAAELPQAAEFLATAGGYINGWVSLEERISKSIVNDKPQTRRFMVPIIEIDVTPAELMAGRGRVAAPALTGGPAGDTPALAAGGPDYVALAADIETADEIRDLWFQARDAGHLTQGLAEHLTKRAAELKAAATGGPPEVDGPVPDADGVVDAEVVDDGSPDADEEEAAATWDRIVTTAGAIGWSTSQLHKDFESRMGMPSSQAATAELLAYLEQIKGEQSEQVPA